MGISLLTNVASLVAQANLNSTQKSLSASIEKLSSGQRINSAGDDAAGLGISESLSSDILSLGEAQQNTTDATSLGQVAEGSLNDIQNIVARQRQLAVQASNATLGSTERGFIQTEFTQLNQEINRISGVTNFDGQNLLDGTASSGLHLQVGINNTVNDHLALSITRVVTSTLGSTSLHLASVSLSTATNALAALGAFDKATFQLSQVRAKIGAVENRLADTADNLSTAVQNLSQANSGIRDVNVASETAKLTSEQILSQAGVAVLSQANQIPSAALTLLKG